MLALLGISLLCYIIGSVPTAYLIAIKRGFDLKKLGSCNVGTSNLTYHCGNISAIPTILFDVFVKGCLPTLLTHNALDMDPFSFTVILPCLASLTGHNWSLFLKFKGGRGVLVIFGILISTMPLMLIVPGILFLIGWLLCKATAIWVLLTLVLVLISSFLFPTSEYSILMVSGCLVLLIIKRLLANLDPIPQNLPKQQVALNRLLHDRDIPDRSSWISRRHT